ncbi:MAG TPA: ABC transporter permease subunit [Blastocatellia bacterium]|nr:ABC transporter permease subunit [Blastocatellia bacterium]
MSDLEQANWPLLPTLSPRATAIIVEPFRWIAAVADLAAVIPSQRRNRVSESQTWLIAEKEISANIQNLKVPAAFSLMTILILISFFLMSADYQKRLDNWSTNKAAQSDNLFSGITSYYRTGDNRAMSMNGNAVSRQPLLRRPLPLSIFAKGLDSVMERSVTIGDNPLVVPATSFTFGAMQEKNRNLLLFAPPDYLYIIKIILSLLALFFTYDALVGEKEMGTLKAMLSGAVPRRSVLIGKWLGASLSLVVPFIVATGIGFIYLLTLRHLTFDTPETYRILLALATSSLYVLVFVGLGLLISAITKTQKTAIASALSIWILLVLVIPNMSVLIAERMKPLPTLFEHNVQLFTQARQIEDEAERVSPSQFTWRGYGTIHDSAGPRIRQMVAQADDAFVAERLGRDRFARTLARLSPASSFTYAITDLAGTGVSEYQAYLAKLQQARNKQIEITNEQKNMIELDSTDPDSQRKTNEKLKALFDRGKQLEQELHESLLTPRSPMQAISDSLPDLALLIIWAGLLLVFATLAFNRADVR